MIVLMALPNCLAVCGEDLVVHRFELGTVGSAASEVCQSGESERAASGSYWSKLKRKFSPPVPSTCTAFWVPPGARLLVRDFPEPLQRIFSLKGPVHKVRFTQIGTAGYHDAIPLCNGAELLLQRLIEGQRVRVLAITVALSCPRAASFAFMHHLYDASPAYSAESAISITDFRLPTDGSSPPANPSGLPRLSAVC